MPILHLEFRRCSFTYQMKRQHNLTLLPRLCCKVLYSHSVVTSFRSRPMTPSPGSFGWKAFNVSTFSTVREHQNRSEGVTKIENTGR